MGATDTLETTGSLVSDLASVIWRTVARPAMTNLLVNNIRQKASERCVVFINILDPIEK